MAKLLLNANGKVLLDKNKVITLPKKYEEDDIVGDDTVSYYKATRNKNYPYFPLPSEMEDEEDTIYMLYSAKGYNCCPAFKIKFTNCTVTIQKYMNKTLVNEYVDSDITSGTNKYMQFSEEDSDYSTYNYIVIKLQGNITYHSVGVTPKFNGISYSTGENTNLIEVSGKCSSCDISVGSTSGNCHINLEYYSFLGSIHTSMYYMFNKSYSLKTIVMLDTPNVASMGSSFRDCYSLEILPEFNVPNLTQLANAFYFCYNLKKLPSFVTQNVDSWNSMITNCYSLEEIPAFDMIKAPSLTSAFNNCYKLKKIDMFNIPVSFDISTSKWLSQTELVKILNNLATVETTQTLKLGSTLLAKLTDDEKAIATNKGWTLA